MPHALVLAFLAGCPVGSTDDTEADTDTDSTTADACGTGLHQTHTASMNFPTFTLDGVSWFPTFDPNAVITPPPACIDDAGTLVELTFTADGPVFGTMVASAATAGSFNVVDHGTQVTMEMTGAAAPEPFTTASTDWTTGGLDVTSVGSTFAFSLNATSDGQGHLLQLSISGEASQ
jgi:hypothetical protein